MTKSRDTLSRMGSFISAHRAIAVLTAISVGLFVGLLAWSLTALLIAPVAWLLLIAILQKVSTKLDARIFADIQQEPWTIAINGVDVGEMSDDIYARIIRDVIFDARTYVSQLINVFGSIMRAFNYLYAAIPFGVFWLAIVYFYVDPSDFVSTLHEAEHLSVADIHGIFKTIAVLFPIWILLTSFAYGLCGMHAPFGLQNRFRGLIRDHIRLHMNCVADGDIRLYRAAVNGGVELKSP